MFRLGVRGMSDYDIFNGDADGICALQQLRLVEPKNATLITGVKRDVRLLNRVFPGPGEVVTVLDVSLDANRGDLARILRAGAFVTYFDHHFSGVVPAEERLETHLSASHQVCTSLLVDDFLRGAQRLWAIVGAFGDNVDVPARRLDTAGLGEERVNQLRELGVLLNYNSYGRTVEDLHVAPDDLYRLVSRYRDPFDFIAGEKAFLRLREGFAADMARATVVKPAMTGERLTVHILPDAAWSRRISGVIANALSHHRPDASHAVIVPNSATCFMVSIRVPEGCGVRADSFCREFDSGGGRATAGGINHLPARDLDDFLHRFEEVFS
jgi:hypothetical protein